MDVGHFLIENKIDTSKIAGIARKKGIKNVGEGGGGGAENN